MIRIGILLFSDQKNPFSCSTTAADELIKAAQVRGHLASVVVAKELTFTDRGGKIIASYESKRLPKLDVIIVRPNFSESPDLYAYPSQMLSLCGYKVINNWPSYSSTKNKIDQHVMAYREAVPRADWAVGFRSQPVMRAAETLGYPLVVKVPRGSWGHGVFYADSPEVLRPIIDFLTMRYQSPVILERFVKEADRSDVRVFVIGGKIAGCMRRKAPKGDVRSNTSNGGRGYKVKITKEEEKLAIRMAELYGLEIAGIDLLRSKKGPLVMEVNANPGFKELTRATGIDIAGVIIDYAVEVAKKK
jgi:ribosomal protein S6--L-glutamate ligase